LEEELKQIKFDNKTNPQSYFEIVRVEDLLAKELNHDVSKSHIVKFFVILLITEGQGYHTIDFTDYQYNEGTVLLIRKDQLHKFFKSPTVKGYLIVFTEDFIISHLNEMQASKSLQLFNEVLNFPKIDLRKHDDQLKYIVGLIEEVQSEYELNDNYSSGITRSILHILVTKLFRIKSSEKPPEVSKKYISEFLTFQSLVEQNCLNQRKVKYYAGELGCTTKTLNNVAQSVLKKSAKTFIDEVAVMHIKRLLLGTNMPIKEIAFNSGFDDPSNFFRYFKKFAKVTPEAFRIAHH